MIQMQYKETIPYMLQWYDYNQRILPWRSDPKPYYVWISEIMLQQTRVEAVRGYFDRFTTELKTVKDLAMVPEEKLLKLWEGLGYYNRAKNLKKAAVIIMEQYDGELPNNYEELMKLPGIGSYTAGAIASIAFHQPVPAVDGNVLRVMNRVTASFEDIAKDKVKKQMERDLLAVMPKDRPGDYNQSLMELGATVCIPNGKPLCEKCPLMHLCKAFHQDLTEQIPVKSKKKARVIERKTVFVLSYQGKYAIQKRAENGLLGGLWELPNVDATISYDKIHDLMIEWNQQGSDVEYLKEAKHIFTHKEWHMVGYHIHLSSFNGLPFQNLVWADAAEIQEKYTLPSAFAAYRSCIR